MIHLDSNLINNHHSLQWRDAEHLLRLCTETLKWGDLSGETIMDIGCGPGSNSTKMLLRKFPNVKRIIATDGSESMIQLAKSDNPHPKVEYFVSDIQDESSLVSWYGTMSKVIAINCFHWLKNQIQGFRNVHRFLKPGGEAALLFVLNAPNFDVCQDLKEHPKWKEFTRGKSCGIPESHSKKFDASHYYQILIDAGFDVVMCEEKLTIFPFSTDEDYKGFLSSVCPLVKHIPENLKEEFQESLLKGVLERCGRSPDGRPNFHCGIIIILVRKPLETATKTS